jgi:MOSC domain-containing protein YiiM
MSGTRDGATGRLLGIASRERPGDPLQTCDGIEIGPDGLPGERKRSRKRQITVLAREDWEAACAEAGAALPWTTRRANLLVEGISLARSTGQKLRIGGALLQVTAETGPCAQMDAAHRGLRRALEPEWRGGVSCRVLEAAPIRSGDPVRFG